MKLTEALENHVSVVVKTRMYIIRHLLCLTHTVTSSKPPLPQSCPKFPPPILHITPSDSAEVLQPPLVPATAQAVQLRAPGELTRTRDSAVSTDSGLGGEFPSHSDRDSSVSFSPLGLQVSIETSRRVQCVMTVYYVPGECSWCGSQASITKECKWV